MLNAKYCKKCGELKCLSLFYKNRRLADGKTVYCKACDKQMSKDYYRDNHSKVRQRLDKYKTTDEGRQTARKSYSRMWEKHKEKMLARNKARYALKTGKIEKCRCMYWILFDWNCCGIMEMHHDDYSKPLDVTWLCQKHHRLAESIRRCK